MLTLMPSYSPCPLCNPDSFFAIYIYISWPLCVIYYHSAQLLMSFQWSEIVCVFLFWGFRVSWDIGLIVGVTFRNTHTSLIWYYCPSNLYDTPVQMSTLQGLPGGIRFLYSGTMFHSQPKLHSAYRNKSAVILTSTLLKCILEWCQLWISTIFIDAITFYSNNTFSD